MAIKIEDLLKNKGILDEKISEKTKELTIKSLKETGIGDGKIIIKSLDMDTIQNAIREAKGDMYKSSIIACYKGIVEPNLKDKKLHEGYGCKTNPHGIVNHFLDPSEVKAVSDEISALSGVGRDASEVIEEIKK
ncbi:hypothetical protein OD350_06320 [Clostridium beijerinckii]|uniref:phage tail assembly chaperone n=1 Tax=Clostridium beijerinckii TaxID=1520 RepID=UPI0022260077|nr:hypothetical protein [Clostridium beijerinckii]UYZ37276.1 hypothetical protein OD350_06320 [Clostridium beijerinckii]